MRNRQRRGTWTAQCLLIVALLTLNAAAAETGQPPRRESPDIKAILSSSQACDTDLCRYSTLQRALKLDPANEQANLALADYYSRRGQLRLSRNALAALLEAQPQSRTAHLRLAQLDIREGLREEALLKLRRLEPPADLAERMQFALAYESLGLLGESAAHATAAAKADHSDSQAQALVIRLSERLLDPGLLKRAGVAVTAKADTLNSSLRSAWLGEESATALSSTDPANQDEDAPYLADVESLSHPADHKGDALLLADIRIERVQPNGLAAKRIQQIVYLGSEAAAREYSTRRVQYEPSIESLTVVHALLHKRDGRIIAASDEGDSFVADLATAMYYDSRSRLLRFAGAEPGDVVELDYRTRPVAHENPYGNYFATLQVFQETAPARLKRYVLVAPTDRQLFITGERAPEPAVSIADGLLTRVWEVRNAPALSNEPLSPALTERAPYVHVSTLRDAAELGRWYAQMLEPQLVLPPELKQVAGEIAETTPDALDRVNAVYRYVLAHSRYVAFEFGIHSYKPYPVAQVYARRFGDCKDDASLIVAMLRAVGVDSEFALVRTRSLGRVRPDAVSLSLFNHAMVYVPRFNLWLDGTATYFGLRELPLEDQGATAVTVARNGDAQLRTVALTRAEDNLTTRTIRAQVAPTGAIAFEGEQLTRGEAAPALRREYEHTDQQRDAMQRSLAAVVPNVRLEGMRVQHREHNDPSIDVSFQGVLEPPARGSSNNRTLTLRSTWMPRDYRRKLASLNERSQELVLGAPWKSEENFTFTLPTGARVVSTPEPVRVSGPFGSATLAYKVEGNSLLINTAVEFHATRVRPEDYASFREFCAELDRAFRRDVRLELP